MAGDWARTGVPDNPSRPDKPFSGSFCADAGAPPSKSMSSRFSTLFRAWGGGVVPVTAAAAAAAAKGFSRAFWICSLVHVSNCIYEYEGNENVLNGSPLDGISTESSLANELLWWLVVDRCQCGKFVEELFEKGGR